jgi:tripartite-type tricarboxylate transporter receptor subunit TctC
MRHLIVSALVLFLTGVPAGAAAQPYPSRPVRIVVPFPPGSSPDTLARGLAVQLGSQLGKTIVIDNRSGANGIIGAEIVARAAPDGYTLLHTPPAFVINALVYKNLPYDVHKDYVPVTNVATSGGYLLLVAPSLPARSVQELVALARTTPLSYGSPPAGNTLHLATELFKLRTGAPLQHIPYKGGTETFTALISGQIQVLIVPTTTAVPYVKSGRLRALGFTGSSRLAILPDVPTVVEAGVPNYVVDFTWNGWFAPAGTPNEIVARLQTEVRKAVQAPRMRELLDNSGFTAVANPPDQFRKFVNAEIKRYAEMVREAKVQAE